MVTCTPSPSSRLVLWHCTMARRPWGGPDVWGISISRVALQPVRHEGFLQLEIIKPTIQGAKTGYTSNILWNFPDKILQSTRLLIVIGGPAKLSWPVKSPWLAVTKYAAASCKVRGSGRCHRPRAGEGRVWLCMPSWCQHIARIWHDIHTDHSTVVIFFGVVGLLYM